MGIDRTKIQRAETRKLNKLVKNLPEEKKTVAVSLIKELSYMAGTLAELKEHIDENGAVQWFKNGAQEMWRESPAVKSYNTTIQRYSALYKQLCDLLEDKPEEHDPLMEYLGINNN